MCSIMLVLLVRITCSFRKSRANTVVETDISDKTGKEVITQYTSDLNTHGYFYTDSNGLELITRQRNYRATWPFVNTEPVSGNYAPVNSIISIKDKATQLTYVI
jgi:lysosomal alpha-mannosidase